MKVLHLALQAPYNEGWGYQENLLTKYQVKLGNEVVLVTTCNKNSGDSRITVCEPEDYISSDGFRVIRLDYEHFYPQKIANLLQYFKIYKLLKEIRPDFIMVHGLSNISVIQIQKYLKNDNPNCVVIADNHMDYNNAKGYVNKNISMKIRMLFVNAVNKKMNKIYRKVYGVTPIRCEFANEIFGTPKEKLDVLPAGADDEYIDFENKEKISKTVRNENEISDDDFLIITGGKIDKKKNIDILMDAISKINNEKIKLLVFGKCDDQIKEKIEALAKHHNIRYVGWVDSKETYKYFLASDLVFFPGQHSVMWEQACACGTPCVFTDVYGVHHVDIGGNCLFLKEVTVDKIIDLLENLLNNPQEYNEMLKVAKSEKRKTFLYSELAKKSLETVES